MTRGMYKMVFKPNRLFRYRTSWKPMKMPPRVPRLDWKPLLSSGQSLWEYRSSSCWYGSESPTSTHPSKTYLSLMNWTWNWITSVPLSSWCPLIWEWQWDGQRDRRGPSTLESSPNNILPTSYLVGWGVTRWSTIWVLFCQICGNFVSLYFSNLTIIANPSFVWIIQICP